MAAPVTQTDIVNAAAALLGSSSRITNIEGADKLAIHARAVWDMTMRTLLADHPWNFAIERAHLNASAAPTFGYERTFAKPATCLRLLPSRITDGSEIYYDGEVEGDYILTDAEAPLAVRFISSRYINDCGRWPPHFAKAAGYALAMDLAEALTGSQGIDSKLTEKADAALRRAKRVDGLETQNGRRGAITRNSRWLGGMAQPFVPYAD